MNRFVHREVKVAWDNFRVNAWIDLLRQTLVGGRFPRLAALP